MKFNEKLLELRKKEGLSQEELADKVDVSRQTVSKWEAGQTTPEMEKLIKLSEIFKVSVDELTGKEIKKEEPKENGKVKTKKNHPLLRLFLIIVIIYFVISLYKFIALTLINDIGQSFYEESYSITEKIESYDNSISLTPNITELYIVKIKNRYIDRLYDRNGRADNPFDITYVEIEKKQASNFSFDKEKQKYIVSDRLAGLSEEEKAEYFENINSCKSFKDIAAIDYSLGGKLAVALNPLTFVNGVNNTIYIAIPFDSTIKMKFNNDFLLTETVIKQWGTDKKVVCSISYDYVPDHFTNMKIQNPFGTYKNQFEYDENYWK